MVMAISCSDPKYRSLLLKLDLFQIAAVLATEASPRTGAHDLRRTVQFLFASMTVELPTRSLLLPNFLAHFCAHYSAHRWGSRVKKVWGWYIPSKYEAQGASSD
jgi:hypothetical protein